MVTDNEATRSDKSPWIPVALIGSLVVLIVVLGMLAYWRLSQSQQHILAALHQLDRRGAKLDAEGCVSAVLTWHDHCQAINALCDHAVPMAMAHCLSAADRTKDCSSLGETERAQWTYFRCLARGIVKGPEVTPCTDAYRALAQFCRSGQKGVIL